MRKRTSFGVAGPEESPCFPTWPSQMMQAVNPFWTIGWVMQRGTKGWTLGSREAVRVVVNVMVEGVTKGVWFGSRCVREVGMVYPESMDMEWEGEERGRTDRAG